MQFDENIICNIQNTHFYHPSLSQFIVTKLYTEEGHLNDKPYSKSITVNSDKSI